MAFHDAETPEDLPKAHQTLERHYDIDDSNRDNDIYWSQVHFPQFWVCAQCGIVKDDHRARKACVALNGDLPSSGRKESGNDVALHATFGIFFVIRHIASGLLMPQAKRNRGYSHWNPAIVGQVFDLALDVPRLLHTRNSAVQCIAQWAACPNGRHTSYQTYDGYDDDGVDCKDDGRKKEDLEIIEVVLVEKR